MIRILLLEDSKFLRLATERALTRAGYEVFAAMDGEQAVTAARERRPDLILLDMHLPKTSGPDVLKVLKDDPATAEIPVVIMSTLPQPNEKRLQHDGAFAYLERTELRLDKGAETLVRRLREILEKISKRRAASAGAH